MAALKYLAPLCLIGCGDLQGFGGPEPPLATIRISIPTAPDGDLRDLQVALVYGAQWLPEPICFLPPPSPEVAMVVAEGCRDTFGFVPDRVAATVTARVGTETTLELPVLPSPDVMVGDVTSRVAYASFVLYDDRNGSGTLELDRPRRLPSGNDMMMPPPDGGPIIDRDVVYGASFSSMLAMDQRLAFREGTFNAAAAFYPRSGCGAPLPGFSIVGAGGFARDEAFAAVLRGELPQERQPELCSEQLPDDAVVEIFPEVAGALQEVACEERRDDSSVRYREPPQDTPNLVTHAFACTSIPDFGSGAADGIVQLVVASNRDDRCVGLTHYVLRGCNNDPQCALPDWDYTASPPAWWPCAP